MQNILLFLNNKIKNWIIRLFNIQRYINFKTIKFSSIGQLFNLDNQKSKSSKIIKIKLKSMNFH